MITNTQTPIYNGKNIRFILQHMHPNMRACKVHRNDYIKNCLTVHDYEKFGANLGMVEHLKNYNFNLVNLYLTGKI